MEIGNFKELFFENTKQELVKRDLSVVDNPGFFTVENVEPDLLDLAWNPLLVSGPSIHEYTTLGDFPTRLRNFTIFILLPNSNGFNALVED